MPESNNKRYGMASRVLSAREFDDSSNRRKAAQKSKVGVSADIGLDKTRGKPVFMSKKAKMDRQAGRNEEIQIDRAKQFAKDSKFTMDMAMYKAGDGTMAISHDALDKVIKVMKDSGRKGDTELVHVNKAEEEMLKAKGGSGTTNPKTGLKEYYNVAGSSTGQGAGEREGYSGGGFGGTAAAHSGGGGGGNNASNNSAPNSGRNHSEVAAEAVAAQAQAAKATNDPLGIGVDSGGIGKTIGAIAGSMSPLGPIGGLLGGLVGKLIGDQFGPPTAADIRGNLRGDNLNAIDGTGKLGSKGGGRTRADNTGSDVPLGGKNKNNVAGVGVGPGSNTPQDPTAPQNTQPKDYIDTLIERFKFPYFTAPPTGSLHEDAHQQLIDSVIGNR